MKPVTDQAYKLMHDGCIALSQVEANGMRIDTDYLDKAIAYTSKKIQHLTQEMKEDKVFKIWRKHYGQRTNIGSLEQLGNILFKDMDYPCPTHTKTGRPKTDEAALDTVDLKFVRNFTKLSKLKKAKNTYLMGIQREVDTNGFLHPFFNLNLVQTMRGSSDHPNFTNIPIRDPRMAKLIRRAFIARPNHRIVETDYSGIEICGAACYHKDPRMISYIKTNPGQLHMDLAQQCYMLPKKEMKAKGKEDAKRIKDIRYCGKNKFIFPQFYGDWYLSCAKSLWEAISQMRLKTRDGLSLKKHLRSQGIKKLGACNPEERPRKGTFEHHLKEVENDFWNNRFKVYSKWKKQWFQEYLEKGYFITLTGFKIEGYYDRKQVINYPVQGSAFHWLLWSLIRINKLLRKYKMKSVIIGQIHDSMVGDIHKKEVKDYLDIANQVMTIDVRKHWDWIIFPLTIEAEVAPVGGSWYEKEEVKI